VLLEKLRGLAGQRRYAIARDVYDVHCLLTRAGLDIGQLSLHAPRKFLIKKVALSATTLESLMRREPEFRLDWARNVEKVVPGRDRAEFEPAWESTVRAMSALVEAAAQTRPGGEPEKPSVR
jgi:predicted nucleotidyltransferase component of viral defense system